MTVTVKEYQESLLKCGVAAEVQSPEHMKALCEAVLSEDSDADAVARCVVANGWFTTKERTIERHLLIVPPDADAIRSVIKAMMSLPARCDAAGVAAISVLQSLRPSGARRKIKVPRKRLLTSLDGEKGDIASAYSAHILSQCPTGDRQAVADVPFVEVEGKRWIVVSGQQEKSGSSTYLWDAAEAVPEDEWEPNPDDWHFYYGRLVRLKKGGKAKRFYIGRRITFVPEKRS